MSKKDVIILVIFGLLLILPIFIADNIYPFSYPINDFQNDVNRAELTKTGGNVHDISNQYFGRTAMAYVVGGISNVTGVDTKTVQTYANYTLLFVTCIAIYFVISKLFNIMSGVIASILIFFCTHSMLTLFSAGDIWNIIEIGIVLVPALYFLARWLSCKRKFYLIMSLVLFAIFSSIHPLALTLPYIMIVSFGCYIVYKLIKRENKEAMKLGVLLVGIVIGNLLLSAVFIKDALWLHYTNITGIIPDQIVDNPIIMYKSTEPIGIFNFLYTYLSFSTLGVLVIALLFARIGKIKYKLTQEAKWFLVLLATFAVPFLATAVLGMNADPIRQAMNAGTMIAIGTGCLIGIVIERYKSKVLIAITSGVIAIGIIPTLIVWFSNQGK